MELATDRHAREPRVRLFVEVDLAAGAAIELGAEQAHYLTRVMRLSPGATVSVFNGRDGEWSAELVSVAKRSCVLQAARRSRPQQDAPDLYLLFAPVKRQPLDQMVRHATELGVGQLQPVLTARTVADRVNLDRLRAITVEAAEQSERLDVPTIAEPQRFDRVLADWDRGRRLFLCDESGRGAPVAAAFAAAGEGPAALLCGPEGGFTAEELDAARDLPFVASIALGPRILRAETAALAVLAVWQAVRGDWVREAPKVASDLAGYVPHHS